MNVKIKENINETWK